MNEPQRLHFQCFAMAAPFEIILDADRPEPQLKVIAENAFELVRHLEGQLSAFIPTSDVCWINQTAADYPVRVEYRLYELLKVCQQIYLETDGAFDITAGPLLRTWGFFHRQGRIPEQEEIEKARVNVGMKYVHLNDDDNSVSFEKPGVEIGLGAVGKGYVVDRIVEALRQWGITSAVVHSGQSSIAAIGKPGGSEVGWRFGVSEPGQPDRAVGSLLLCDAAMSVSGNWEQCFRVGDTVFSHIINPTTGQPAQGVLGTAVVGPSAALTDALSTAFFVMGAEKARDFCKQKSNIGGVVIEGDSPERMTVHTFNCTLEQYCQRGHY